MSQRLRGEVTRSRPGRVGTACDNVFAECFFVTALDEAGGHAGVVGPGAARNAEGAAPEHVVEGLEGARRSELERGAHRVSDHAAEEGAALAVGVGW